MCFVWSFEMWTGLVTSWTQLSLWFLLLTKITTFSSSRMEWLWFWLLQLTFLFSACFLWCVDLSCITVFPFRVKCCILSTSKEESTFHTYISVPVFIFSKGKDRGAADVKRKEDWGIKKSTHRQFCGLSGMLTVSLIVLLQNTEMQPHSQKVLSSVPTKAFAVLHPCLFFSAIFGDTFVSVFGSMSDIVVLAHMNECGVESWQKSRSHLFSMLDCLISLWLRAWCDRAGRSGSALNPDRSCSDLKKSAASFSFTCSIAGVSASKTSDNDSHWSDAELQTRDHMFPDSPVCPSPVTLWQLTVRGQTPQHYCRHCCFLCAKSPTHNGVVVCYPAVQTINPCCHSPLLPLHRTSPSVQKNWVWMAREATMTPCYHL